MLIKYKLIQPLLEKIINNYFHQLSIFFSLKTNKNLTYKNYIYKKAILKDGNATLYMTK